MRVKLEYIAPATVEEALRLIAEYGEEAKILAGGQSLLLFLKQGLVAPSYLIDIKTNLSKELSYINVEDGILKIGSLTTHRDVEKSRIVKDEIPILADVEKDLADVQIRNWGTVGGNICVADPTADLPPVLVVLGTKLKVRSLDSERLIPVEDFYVNLYETVLSPAELLVEVQIPKIPRDASIAYERLSHMKGERPVVSAAAFVRIDHNSLKCEEVRIAVGGAGSTVIRARRAESLCRGEKMEENLLQKVGDHVADEIEPSDDIYYSRDYKREMIKVLVRRALYKAVAKIRP